MNDRMTDNQLREFIESLELPETDASLKADFRTVTLETLKDGDKAGFVDDGSLISFVAGVSAQHQSDVLNSTLLAQLAANKKYDRWDDTENWYKFYVDVLGKVGWVIQNFDFAEFTASGTTFTVNEVVIKILTAIATQNELLVVKETIDALKSLSDGDGRLVLFDTQSSDMGKGNFQISVASESGGLVAMKVGAFYFKSSQTTTRFLWFGYSSSNTHLFKGSESITLNEDVYKQVRQQVIDKLGDNAKTFIGDLDI